MECQLHLIHLEICRVTVAPLRSVELGKTLSVEFDLNDDHVHFRQDKPDHGLFEPAYPMSLEVFQKALADLANRWKEL